MTKEEREDIFNRIYFEGGSRRAGYYQKSYEFNRLYPFFEFVASQIKKHFDVKTVLDIGCAKGFLVLAFRNLLVEAYGVDISEYAISCAPNKIKQYLYKVDIEKDSLPFEDEYFDFITLFETIEYLHDHSLILDEIKRVLRTDEIVYLKTIRRKKGKEDIRVNIHSRKYWIQEFEKHGFEFFQNEIFLKNIISYEIQRNFAESRKNPTIKFKIGKLLFNLNLKNFLMMIMSKKYHNILFIKK